MQRLIDCTNSSGESAAQLECRRLEHLLSGYQQFLGHDLGNQLVPIQGFARMLQEQCRERLDPEAGALLSRLADLTRRADLQARRLANIGRLLREPAWGPAVSLREAVAEALAEVKYSPRGVSPALASGVACDVVQQMPVVRVSRALLHAVLVELLHNAFAAVASAQSARVEILATSSESAWELTLHDHGRGMDESQVARLGAVGLTGAGLGFFLVTQAVARWGGRLKVCSEVGLGTTISLLIPEKEA